MSFIDDFWHDVPPDDYDGGGYRRGSRKKSTFVYYHNPLFDTQGKQFEKIEHETDKAYLLKFREGKAWVPKSKVRLYKTMVYLPMWLFMNLEFKD